jgi:hypothetical protein
MTWQKVHFFIFLASFFAASGSLSGCFARLRSQIAPRNSEEIPEERVRLLSLKMASQSEDAKSWENEGIARLKCRVPDSGCLKSIKKLNFREADHEKLCNTPCVAARKEPESIQMRR